MASCAREGDRSCIVCVVRSVPGSWTRHFRATGDNVDVGGVVTQDRGSVPVTRGAQGAVAGAQRAVDGPDRAVVGDGPVLSRAKLSVLDYDSRQEVMRLERDRQRHVRALAYLDRQRGERTRELNAINRALGRYDTEATREISVIETAVGAGALGGAGALASVRAMTLEGSPVQRHVLETLRAAVDAGAARGAQKAVDGFTPRDLVSLTGRTLDSVRTALRCLHGLGYVTRVQDDEDGRITRWLPAERD